MDRKMRRGSTNLGAEIVRGLQELNDAIERGEPIKMTTWSTDRYRLIIFDLDGTLVDSLQDIAESLNECIELLGLPTRPIADFRYMVGEGVPALCQRAIGGIAPHLVPRLIELARARYRTRSMRHSRPYAGVPQLVDQLAALGLTLGVLSNKPHDMTTRMVRAFWPSETFRLIQGYVREEHRKPSPQHVHEMCTALNITPAQVCLVGDTPTDVLTARNAGCECVAVTWGFRTRDDLLAAGATCIVDTPEQVAAAILRQAQ
ncbi:MAG: HAD family hydrolase [Phycisphaerae bacterium]